MQLFSCRNFSVIRIKVKTVLQRKKFRKVLFQFVFIHRCSQMDTGIFFSVSAQNGNGKKFLSAQGIVGRKFSGTSACKTVT